MEGNKMLKMIKPWLWNLDNHKFVEFGYTKIKEDVLSLNEDPLPDRFHIISLERSLTIGELPIDFEFEVSPSNDLPETKSDWLEVIKNKLKTSEKSIGYSVWGGALSDYEAQYVFGLIKQDNQEPYCFISDLDFEHPPHRVDPNSLLFKDTLKIT